MAKKIVVAMIAIFLVAVLITGCKKTTKEAAPIGPAVPAVTTSDINATVYESVNDTGISGIEITDEDLDVSV